MAAHLLSSVALHLWMIVEGGHDVLSVFGPRYSVFALAYFGLFAARAWTARLVP
jgi:hypothetical protein